MAVVLSTHVDLSALLQDFQDKPIYQDTLYIEPKEYKPTDEPLGDAIKLIISSLEQSLSDKLGESYKSTTKLNLALTESLENLWQHENSGLSCRFYLSKDYGRILYVFQLSTDMQEPEKLSRYESLLAQCHKRVGKPNFGKWFYSLQERMPLGTFFVMKAPDVTRVGTVLDDKAYFFFEAQLTPTPEFQK
ncbi:MAG: hypothetical protein ABIJ34_07105 [archaeon]